MSEHVCEWQLLMKLDMRVGYKCFDCGNFMSWRTQQVLDSLNSTERLRAGIDELMDATKDDPNEMGGPFVSLSWVANILEGKSAEDNP